MSRPVGAPRRWLNPMRTETQEVIPQSRIVVSEKVSTPQRMMKSMRSISQRAPSSGISTAFMMLALLFTTVALLAAAIPLLVIDTSTETIHDCVIDTYFAKISLPSLEFLSTYTKSDTDAYRNLTRHFCRSISHGMYMKLHSKGCGAPYDPCYVTAVGEESDNIRLNFLLRELTDSKQTRTWDKASRAAAEKYMLEILQEAIDEETTAFDGNFLATQPTSSLEVVFKGTTDAIQCRPLVLSSRVHAVLGTPYNNLLSDQVVLTCEDGYIFTNGHKEVVMTCLENGQWNMVEPECKEYRCPDLQTPSNVGSTFGVLTGNKPGMSVTFVCAENYGFCVSTPEVITKTVTCQEDATWDIDTSEEECVSLFCSDVSVPNNALLHAGQLTNNVPGMSVTFLCDETYTLTSTDSSDILQTLECLKGSVWDSLPQNCVLDQYYYENPCEEA